MKPEAQWYLVEALARARGHLGILDDYESKQRAMSHFAGVLAAFRYQGDVTQEEEQDWYRKMLVVQGYEPPDPPPPGVAQAIYLGDPEKRPPPLPAEIAPTFIRSQRGPDQEFEVFNGRLRVISIEIYDVAAVIRWRVWPEPVITLAFPEESAALELDLIGLEEWAADDLRMKGHEMLRRMRLYRFELTDDVGTDYVQRGQRHGGAGGVTSGEAEFRPSPPGSASTLTISWLNLRVPVALQ
jgi:hypothetical protein